MTTGVDTSATLATGKDNDQQHSILTAKVSRALEVRTDTPAMKAALDALAHLPDHQDEMFTVDSRSVRVAIEQDALQQALLLQGELQKLLDTVVALRQGVTETAAIAHRVSDAIHTNVITTETMTTETATTNTVGTPDDPSASSGGNEGNGGVAEGIAPPVSQLLAGESSGDDSLEKEQQLAALLTDAFHQRNVARKRLDAVHSFLEKFDLKEEDARLLDSYAFEDILDGGVSTANGMAFLAALERVRLIRKELGRTFGRIDVLHQQERETSGGENNRLGASSALRMMETLAQKQERAYERLYHWLQKFLQLHSHTGDSSSAPSPDNDQLDEALSNPFVRRSLFALRNVPAFYSHLLELVAGSRRAEETRRFLLALTSGYGGFPPIEMKAHDSVVYVGDMLAFCFRAFSVEADVAKGLFNYNPEDDIPEGGTEESKEGDAALLKEDEDAGYMGEKPMTAIDMLSQGMSGVSRPLKSRILQVVANLSRHSDAGDDDDVDSVDDDLEEEGSVARSRLAQLYEICGLLLFYMSALEKGVQKLQIQEAEKTGTTVPDNTEIFPIILSILDCLGEAANAYEASLRVYGTMLEQLNVLTGETEARLAYVMIERLVNVRQSSPGFAQDVACPKDYQKKLSLEWACDVLVETALPHSKSLDDTVSLKQCIGVVSKAGASSSSEEMATKLAKMVQDRETSLIDVLVEKETTDVLDLCGLGTLVSALDKFQSIRVDGMLMVTHPDLSQEDVESSMKEFYSSLYSPPIPSFDSIIRDPTMRKLARTKIASNVCAKYAELYAAMTSTEFGGYDDLSFLGHTPTQVQTLFSV